MLKYSLLGANIILTFPGDTLEMIREAIIEGIRGRFFTLLSIIFGGVAIFFIWLTSIVFECVPLKYWWVTVFVLNQVSTFALAFRTYFPTSPYVNACNVVIVFATVVSIGAGMGKAHLPYGRTLLLSYAWTIWLFWWRWIKG
jgi:hypothetical protein